VTSESNLRVRMKAARQARGITQKEAAAKARFSRRSWEAWEGGFKSPAPLYREKLEKFLRRIEAQANKTE
jgi:transcriptional regulator with XRE-family HTH domain